MTERLVVLVRGVNVGGKNRLPMKDFAALLGELGCTEVRTYVNSGNAVVSSDRSADALTREVEKALDESLTLPVRVAVRTAAELAAVVAANPFPDKESTPKQLHVTFVDDPPTEAAVSKALAGLPDGCQDTIAVGERCLYSSYAGSTHDSPLVKLLIRLAPAGTARNWSTVLKLRDLSASAS